MSLVSDDFDVAGETSLLMIGYHGGEFGIADSTGTIFSEGDYPYEVTFNWKIGGGASGAPMTTHDGDVVGMKFMRYGKLSYAMRSKYIRGLLKGDIGVRCQSSSWTSCIDRAMAKTWKMTVSNEYAQFQAGSGGGYITQQGDKELMLRSARAGFILAQRELCVSYYYGENGFPVDKAKSRFWCRKASAFGR